MIVRMRAGLWDILRRSSPPGLRRWVKNRSWFIPLSERLFGNAVYSRSYYSDLERIEADSARAIARWIVDQIAPKAALDVGCGSGLLMNELHALGVAAQGVDLSPAAIEMVRAKGLPGEVMDLTNEVQQLPEGPFDLAISCEVAEHLPEQYAELFVRRMTSIAPQVFLTAAEPDPTAGPGLYHYNEQPNEYWVELFAQRGFELDDDLTADARGYLEQQNVISYLAKPMILRRRESA